MARYILVLGAFALALAAAALLRPGEQGIPAAVAAKQATTPGPGEAVATFGSGCFWCTEADFDKVDGVKATISGYMGGMTLNPTYGDVSTGHTGHAEVLQVIYDPSKVSYSKLLDYYWRHTDVLDGRGQFCDRGTQYRPVIFTHDDEQHRLARAAKDALEKSGRFSQPVAVEIKPASAFTPAEDYHQDYYKKNPRRYTVYRYGCGRDARLQQLWGEPSH